MLHRWKFAFIVNVNTIAWWHGASDGVVDGALCKNVIVIIANAPSCQCPITRTFSLSVSFCYMNACNKRGRPPRTTVSGKYLLRNGVTTRRGVEVNEESV